MFIFYSRLVWGLWRGPWRNLMMSEERSFLKWLWVPRVVHPLLQAQVCVSVLLLAEVTYLLLVFKFVWCDVFSLHFCTPWYANYSSKLWCHCSLSGGGFLAFNLGFKFLVYDYTCCILVVMMPPINYPSWSPDNWMELFQLLYSYFLFDIFFGGPEGVFVFSILCRLQTVHLFESQLQACLVGRGLFRQLWVL